MAHPVLTAVLAAVFALGSSAAFAQGKPKPATTNPALPTENFHAQCIGCHGIPGYKTAFPEVYHVPKIAGQQPGYIIAALKAYKSGDRSHPSMRGIAASMNDEQMKVLADFYGAPAK
jgi:cytochrome c553